MQTSKKAMSNQGKRCMLERRRYQIKRKSGENWNTERFKSEE